VSIKPKQHWVGVAVLGLCFGLIGWLIGFSWVHRWDISELWYQASEQKYLTMTGQAGPVTYLVTHNNFDSLEALAMHDEDILGVEVYELPDKAAVAFTRADTASIGRVRDSEFVSVMRQQIIPMMCH